MTASSLRTRLSASWSLWVLLAIAAVWLGRTPYAVSDLNVIPDSVEYAIGTLQLLDTGRYEIIVPAAAGRKPWIGGPVE